MKRNRDDVPLKFALPSIFLLLGCLLLFQFAAVEAGVPLARFEALMKQQSQTELGLYNSTDKVVILTNANFKDLVLQQNRSALVEFYNSFCGHCKRFAPHYKQLAASTWAWRDVLLVGAIDCAAEENNDICREYEVMAYPTLRYFGPGYTPAPKNYGRPLESQQLDVIRSTLAQWLLAENRTSAGGWPNLQNLTEEEAAAPFEGAPAQSQYVVVVYEPENSTIGLETTLQLLLWPQVAVRRVTDLELAASKFRIDGQRYKLATVDRQGVVVPYAPLNDTATAYAATVESILRAQHVTARPESVRDVAMLASGNNVDDSTDSETQELLAIVQRNKHDVYQADLEMAVRGVLFNEIPKIANISGERLLALHRFLTVLKRYNPLGASGRSFIAKLYDFVMQFNQELTGEQFEVEVKRLEAQYAPIFSASRFVGCAPSRPGLRGFTCSLWQIFHFMTTQAAAGEQSQDPLEVLQAMHGYVKYFFGCTDCSEHFQSMATRRKIWSTPNKDEAVLWLWAAHNEVNQRLAGDNTEDPLFPKIQFPSQASCSQCYRQPIMSPANLEVNWNKDEVLRFLKDIYSPRNINRLGVEHEDILHSSLEKLRQKRMVGNVFSDIDMRMGMLLYGFCIVMMVVAFKLFAFKGYRKKPYGHDMLGKV